MKTLERIRALPAQVGRERVSFLGFITLAHVAIHWFMQLLTMLNPHLKAGMGLNDVQLGGLASMRMFGQAALDVPSGILADRWVRLRGLIVTSSLVCMGLCYWVLGTLTGYWWAMFAVALLAAGTTLFHPASVASLSNRFPESRGTAVAVYGMGATLGNTVSYLVAGFLLASFSWRGFSESQLLVALAAAGLVAMYATRMFGGDEVPARKPRPFQELKVLARSPVILVMVLVRSFNQMARQVTITFLPIYLFEQLALSNIELGIYLTPMAVSGLVAQPVMGVLSDRLGRKAVLAPSLAALGLAYFLLQWAPPGPALAAVVFAIGFLFYTVANVTTTVALDVAEKESQASSFGLVSLGTHILVVPAPTLAGFLSERFGIMAAFFFPGVCLLAGACMVFPLKLRGSD